MLITTHLSLAVGLGLRWETYFKSKIFILIILLGLPITRVWGQIHQGGTPKGLMQEGLVLEIPSHTLPSIPVESLQKEDARDLELGLPPRFGYPHPVALNLANSGQWRNLSNGDRLWQLKIKAPGALSINLLYDQFWIPPGGCLFLYNPSQEHILGGFSHENNRGTGEKPQNFATGLLYGDEIILEYQEPKAFRGKSKIQIAYVVQGYRLIGDIAQNAFGDAGACQVNINCPSEGASWQAEKRGVALILVDGSRLCTGSLVNNTSEDGTPYLLTSDVCTGSLDATGDPQAFNWTFYWNYESPDCGQGSEFMPPATSGATLLANNANSDFALFRLEENPGLLTDVHYNGWSLESTAPLNGACIHHPRGDLKKIATYTNPPANAATLNTPGPAGNFWEVQWAATSNGFGLTEAGSDGAPLFDQNGRIVGQLTELSTLDCSNPSADLATFGKISASWESNNSDPQRSLRVWLDPLNSGASFLNGTSSERLFENCAMNCEGTNVFIGSRAGINNTSGMDNTFLGFAAGEMNTGGRFNTFLGKSAGMANTLGEANTFVGNQSGENNTSGSQNTFLGEDAGFSNTSGSMNTFLGENAGFFNRTGTQNTFLGQGAGQQNVSGVFNTFVGAEAGQATTSGGENTFLGQAAGSKNTTGNNNTFVGQAAGRETTTGGENTFIGFQSGLVNTTGRRNTFLGSLTGISNTTGTENTFFGYEAGFNNTSGIRNVFIGNRAGKANTVGNENMFLGAQAGVQNIDGERNTYLGYEAGSNGTSSSRNLFMGYRAGKFNSSGGRNVFLGYEAGFRSVEGTSNVFIGYHAGYFETGSNKLYIEPTTSSNPLIYGDFSLNVVGINTSQFQDATDTYTLSVNGKMRAREVKVYTGWADFVFEPDYDLPALPDVKRFIAAYGHLPDVPSAQEVQTHGIFLGQMNALLLQKIEELTLYTIEQEETIEVLQAKQEKLESTLEVLLKRMEALENQNK